MANPYEILGVSPEATKQEIKKAYRSLAQKYHPDKEDGDRAQFDLVQWACDVLTDEGRRASYDATGYDDGKGAGEYAYEMVVQVMIKVMMEGKRGDVVQQAMKLVGHEHKHRWQKREQAQDRVDRIKEMYGRVTGGKAFDDAVELAHTQAENELAQCIQMTTVTEWAKDMLKKYKDQRPEEAASDESLYTVFANMRPEGPLGG